MHFAQVYRERFLDFFRFDVVVGAFLFDGEELVFYRYLTLIRYK